VLPSSGHLNSWLAVLAIGLTVIYAWGVIVRHERCVARLGRDSLIALALFGLGVAGMFAIPH
jgi:hypothetical protein